LRSDLIECSDSQTFGKEVDRWANELRQRGRRVIEGGFKLRLREGGGRVGL
jgi:hypothetical protein